MNFWSTRQIFKETVAQLFSRESEKKNRKKKTNSVLSGMTVGLWLYSVPFYFIADGFNLPLKLDAAAKDRMAATGTFQRLMDTMRDAATLSLLERLQRLPKGTIYIKDSELDHKQSLSTTSIMDCQSLHQKIHQKISVIKTNIFVFKTKRELECQNELFS